MITPDATTLSHSTARSEAIAAVQTEQETAQNVLQAMMKQLEEQNKRIAALQQRLAASEANRKQDEAAHQTAMKAAGTELEKAIRDHATKKTAINLEIKDLPGVIKKLSVELLVLRYKRSIGMI